VQNTIGAIQHTAYGGGPTKVSIKICASAARVTGLSPRDVIASFEGGAKAVGGDPRGAAVLRVLRGAEALQGFPTLMHFAMPLLFAASQPFCSLRRRCAICSSLR